MTFIGRVRVNSITIPGPFVAVCNGWYSSADDLLYAVSSTGGLTTGTNRPTGCNIEQWYLTLWRGLSVDIGCAILAARKGYNGESDIVDTEILEDFEEWVDEHVIPLLERSYSLTDWEV